MLPHKHFAVAFVTAAIASFVLFPVAGLAGAVAWALAAGLVSAAIDVDGSILIALKSKNEPRLRRFNNPAEIFGDYPGFLKTLKETRLLMTVSATHVLLSAVFLLLVGFFANDYLIPATLGVFTHLASDFPYLKWLRIG